MMKLRFDHLWYRCHQRSLVEGIWAFLDLDVMFMAESLKSQDQKSLQNVGQVMALFVAVTIAGCSDLYNSTIEFLMLLSAFRCTESVPMLHSCCA